MRSEAQTRAPRWLKVLAWGGLVFLHFPILVVCLYAFNTEGSAFSFPLQGFTLHWFARIVRPLFIASPNFTAL